MTKEDAIKRVRYARFPQQVDKVEKMYCNQHICWGFCAWRKCENCDFERELEEKKKQFKK